MIACDEEALICDLAETYGIFDYKALPLKLVATLSVGLRENSRIKMKLSGVKTTTDMMLLASAVDRLSLLVWAKTEDGQNNVNRPKSILAILTGNKEESDVVAFETVEEFEAERERIMRQVKESGKD